jgi:hypothetical protein
MVRLSLLLLATISCLGSLAVASPIADRLQSISGTYLGRPYADDNLGEGPDAPYDNDPLFREDAFNCTTFIEVAIAKARSHNEATLFTQINLIRYTDGIVDFWTRNHFPSLQWIPNAVRHGFLDDVTHRVGGIATLEAEALIDMPSWASRLGEGRINRSDLDAEATEARQHLLEQLRQEGIARTSAQIARLPYIPLGAVLDSVEIQDRIPHGSVINIVRPNWDLVSAIGTALNVSHQGLVFRIGERLILRHASSTAGQVVDVPLIEYLQGLRSSPTVGGINILEVLTP